MRLKLVLGAKAKWIGGTLAVLSVGLLFALNETPKLIDQLANYPNPFDSRKESTNITYRLPQDLSVKIKIFDLFGFPVKEFEFSAGEMGARSGVNVIQWDGTDSSGSKVSKGGYVCQVIVLGDLSAQGFRKIGVIH